METLKNPYASKLASDFRSFDPGIILMIDDHKKCLAKRPGTFFRGFRKSAKEKMAIFFIQGTIFLCAMTITT